MNNAQQSARVGLFFLLGVALVWVTFETLSSGKFFDKHGYRVVADFDDLKALKVGDEVRLSGVQGGSVERTRLSGRRAEAVLLIDPGVSIEGDAVATVAMSGLIGNSVVQITRGSAGAPPLLEGAEVRTEESPDFNSIMKQLSGVGTQLQTALAGLSAQINGDGKGGPGLFQRLNEVVAEDSGKLGVTLSNLQAITDKINKGDGTIGRLVNDPRLHDELLASVAEIKSAAAQARTLVAGAQAIVDQVKAGQGTVGTLVYDETAAADLKATLSNIRLVTDKLARGEGTLGRLIGDDGMYHNLETTLHKADRTLDGLNDSGPIEAVGVLANSLF